MQILNFMKMTKFYTITMAICIIICIGESILLPFSKNTKNEEDENDQNRIVDPNGHVGTLKLIFLTLYVIFIIIYFIWRLNLNITFLYIPMLLIAFYSIILKPFVLLENNNLEYTTYSSLPMIFCSVIQLIDYEKILNVISNKIVVELLLLFILVIKVYLFLFFILINIRYFLKLLTSIIKFKKINICLSEKLKIKYNLTFKYQHDKNKKKIMIILVYIYETIINIIKSIMFFINDIFLDSMLFILNKVVKFLNIIIKYEDGCFNYLICKILLVVTFISVHVYANINKFLSLEVLNIFEYISTAIIIPVLLDSIISYNNYLKNNVTR